MFELNNKQREELAKSLMKIAEYTLLTLVIAQIAIGKYGALNLLLAAISASFLYCLSLLILNKYKEG